MARKMIPLLVLICVLHKGAAQPPVVPAGIKPFIYPGYEAMDLVGEDLDGDKLKDYLLVLKKKGEDTISFDNPDWEADRPLLLILGQPGGAFRKAAENREIILCKNCGGVFGDPYEGITAKPGEFTASFYGGSSWRWAEEYLFRFDKIKKDWFLESHHSSYFQAGDPENTMEESTIKRAETGDISLKNFSPSYNSDSSSWKVKVLRTYFYSSPDLSSRPRKAYLLKGNTLTSTRQFKNFIECSFTNNKGDITHGFILKKDLQLLATANSKAL